MVHTLFIKIMIKKYVLAISLSIVMVNGLAQDNSSTPKASNPFGFLSAIFSPKPTKLATLIDEKRISEADDYLGSERQYFLTDNRKENQELVARLAKSLNELHEPFFDSSIAAISNITGTEGASEWTKNLELVRVANNLVETYRKYQTFSESEYRSEKLNILESTLLTMKSRLDAGSIKAFANFNHESSENFFTSYPQNLNDSFLSDNATQLEGYVQPLSVEQIILLKKKYDVQIGKDGKFNEKLLSRFVELSMPATSAPHSIGMILATINKAKAAGFSVNNLPGAKIGFVEVTSKTLLNEGQIEFPTQIDMDLPFEAIKTDIDSVLDTAGKVGANFVIVLDVAVSKLSRRIIAKNDMQSKFISGTRSEPNPQYEIARSRIYEAQNGYNNASRQTGGGLAGAILNGIAMGMWANRVKETQQVFSQTPASLQFNEFQQYNFSSSDIAASRVLTANYYVIDKITNRYYKGTFDISENKSFKISYNLHDRDPEKSTILSRYGKEEDIAVYEKSPMTLAVSMLIDDYLKNESKGKALQSVTALRDEMLLDKNKALTAYKSNQYTAKAVNDSRFDSVVVVNNPKGALGTGFFIAPDLVLTNYHVIEGAQFVEMKMYNGMETFGKVVKTDVRLDLALVKVQTRGTPVTFFQGNILELGSTVEAIGHPKGLTFTITRGIISAVRTRPSIYGVGGKQVLFVQTDAAINPGNSGGPLFLGDKFIGVNNNKIVAGSEGLGFAIHYSEVNTFMKESF